MADSIGWKSVIAVFGGNRVFDVIIQLLENFAFVLVIVYLYSSLRKSMENYPFYLRASIVGIVYGAISILAMQRPIEISEGILIDARVVLLVLAGYFSGPLAGSICAIAVSIYRIILGGTGVIPGLFNIAVATILGIVFYYNKKRIGSPKRALLYMGGILTVLSLGSAFLLPREILWDIMKKLVPSVILLYPLGLFSFGMVIVSSERRYEMEKELMRLNTELEEEVRLRTAQVQNINDGLMDEIKVRQETELALKNAEQEATSANKMKSDFLANMSHEIRTPLNAIIGYTHLLSKTDMNEKQKNYLAKMDSSSSNLLSIVNDILDFSKIEAGKVDIAKHPVNLYALINRLADTVNYELLKKRLYLSIHIGKSIPEYVVGDDGHFNQVLLNILSNAVKFTNEGGVTVTVGMESRHHHMEQVRIVIKDTGIGVKEDKVSAIFNEFTQANMSINREFGGTGLGLSITKKLVESMGGTIRFESEYGVGSTMTVLLPVEKSHQRIRHFDEIMTVALVTNQADRYRNIYSQLRRMGVEVRLITTIDQLKAHDGFNYVLVDWEQQFSVMDILFYLIRERVGGHVPIDVISYHRDWQIQRFVEEQEDCSVIFLPVSSDKLIKHMGERQSEDHDHTLEERSHMNSVNSKRILVVEDNQLNQDIERSILEDQGAMVWIASDGAQALDMVQENEFDLILMDIHMPVMGGYDAAKAIRELQIKPYIPIVAMTADVQVGVEEMVKEAGMDDYIKKPINVMEVYKVIAKWL